MTGSFFQVDRRAAAFCADLGMNPLVVYLVLASGTGPDNRTTSWSVNAVEKYTGIGRPRARAAIQVLKTAGLLQVRRGGKSPIYYLRPAHLIERLPAQTGQRSTDPQWVWLPKTIVTGAVSEQAPIERIRQLGDPRTLRLLVSLYDIHDLADNGGIHWRLMRRGYGREKVGEAGLFTFWRFEEKTDEAWFKPPFNAFLTNQRNSSGQDTGGEAMWASWELLKASGLLECVEHLIEADTDEAEILHPCPTDAGTDWERDLGSALADFTEALAGEPTRARIGQGDCILAVKSSCPNVQLVGVYRLRYRPHTKATAAWFARSEDWRKWIGFYRGSPEEKRAGGRGAA